ncbi:site-specific tyrosine recombinase/integron integrase [Candidatus Caldatribacterium saccharofermentans]|uniref:Tyrosine recombinase XerC n=1 Tax=Candidatus Caldatribacterium saccharofermentans TaxID=1454753 RepID=A0A7V4WKC2_9BACT
MYRFESQCSEKEREYLRAYWNYLQNERRCSPHTLENYFRVLGQFVEFLRTRGKDLCFVDTQDVNDFFVYLRVHRKLKRISQSHRASVLRSFFRFLRRRGFLSENPCDGLGQLRVEKKLPQFLTQEEVTKILDTLERERDEHPRDFSRVRNWALLELLYASGVRVSEASRIRLEDIDFTKNTIRVRGKGGKERIVPFNEATRKALEKYLELWRTAFPKAEFLFVNRSGKPLTPRGIRNIVENAASRAGIWGKRVFPHIFRHSFATHFLAGGGELRVIQEALGHSSLSTTQVYTHLDWDKMKKVYENAHPHARRAREKET